MSRVCSPIGDTRTPSGAERVSLSVSRACPSLARKDLGTNGKWPLRSLLPNADACPALACNGLGRPNEVVLAAS